ncbi:MAG TPA: 30S ribosomal protein S8 [Nitrospiria bacterium]
MMTDPISDMLNRINNAIQRKKEQVDVPNSSIKKEIARLLKEEGFIRRVEGTLIDGYPILRLHLKYSNDESIIHGLRRVSRPGRRVYVDKETIPKVRGGMGMAVMSTTMGLLTDRDTRKNGIGGEVICYIW